jgi:hypothetical protein
VDGILEGKWLPLTNTVDYLASGLYCKNILIDDDHKELINACPLNVLWEYNFSMFL